MNGDIKFEVIVPAEFPKDEYGIWLWENGIIEKRLMTIEEAKKRWPDKLAEIDEATN
jgi:hypothetical protein